jgi:hypothetical protein
VAVAGLLDLGRWWRMTRRVKASGEETKSSAASVFDFGYAQGGEQQMVELLHQLLGIARPGRDHLPFISTQEACIPSCRPPCRRRLPLRLLDACAPPTRSGTSISTRSTSSRSRRLALHRPCWHSEKEKLP